MRRVVVTGLGLVTPLGCGIDVNWRKLLAGASGARRIERFEVGDLPCKIACEVPRGNGADGSFRVEDWMEPKEARRVDDFIIFAMAAATMALKDSGFRPKDRADAERAGVIIGSGIGGLPGIAEAAVALHERGPRKISPFFIPGSLINLASGHVSIRYGLKGPNHAVVTACATGAHAIGDASRLIMFGDADLMVAGGTEAAVSRLGIAGFAACRALSTGFNDTPERASRPFDKDRDGFVMGEGAGVVVLEELGHALDRGAPIHAEIVGYGLSGDAYHITQPSEDGDGGYRAMRAALNNAKRSPADIDYINAHGTSTPLGDEIEVKAVERLFGNAASKLSMSSTKSSIGHLLGAAGAVEAIYSTLAIRHNTAPPTINLDAPSMETVVDLVPREPRERRIDTVMSNSFGFGGTNASLILARYVE
jgi:3-oxoacyl-[acyl-carrier-protein] synthase II